MLCASVLAGWLWDRHGPAWTFGAGALISGLALVAVLLMPLLASRLGPVRRPGKHGACD